MATSSSGMPTTTNGLSSAAVERVVVEINAAIVALTRIVRIRFGDFIAVFPVSAPKHPGFGLVELKTKADPRATRVAVILVWVAVISIIVGVSPVMVRLIVPIIFARGITMVVSPVTALLFVA